MRRFPIPVACLACLALATACAGAGASDPGPADAADTPDAADAVDATDAADTFDEADADGPPDWGCGPSDDHPALLDVPVSLLHRLRLSASGTLPRGFWPLEAEDGIATVRDGHPATGWKAPVGVPSFVEADLLPRLHVPRWVSAVSLAWKGAAPRDVSVEVLPSCADPSGNTYGWADPSTPLPVGPFLAGCVRVHLTAPDALTLTALDVLSPDPLLPPGEPADDALPPAAAAVPDSGLVEGFYGVPWSWRERHHAVRVLAALGLDTYLYAPKDDPLHRDRWREPYPEADMAEFRGLAARCAGLGVRFAFGLSPFIEYAPGEADYGALRAKCDAFVDAGAQVVAILGDDIEFAPGVEVDGALAAVHVEVVNRLAHDLAASGVALWFTPTVYSDSRARDWPGGQAYLEALAALDPSVRILWTGPDTGNRTLAAADLAAVTAAIGRKPLIWDNFYANDGGDGAFGRLFLAPYRGRDADLVAGDRAVAGIAQNLSIQGALSRLGLGTFGAWLADPAATPDALRLAAATLESGFGAVAGSPRDRDLLVRVMEVFDGHGTDDPPRFRALDAAAGAVADAVEAGTGVPLAQVGTLMPLLGQMAGLPSDVHHSGLDTDLVDDLDFPLDKVLHESRTALHALDALAARLSGADGAASLQAADDEALLSAQCRFLVSPDAAARVLDAVRGAPPRSAGVVALQASPPPAACRPGVLLAWRPFPEGTEVRAFGLPGATVHAGEVRWTAPHAGRYDAVVTGVRTEGAPAWGWASVPVDCIDPCH